jgi:hypothetical protein
MDAVAAAVCRGYRYVNQLFCKWIEHTGLNHHLFDAGPRSFKKGRLIRESTPEVIYKIRLACDANIVEHGFDRRDGFDLLIGPELYCGHLVVLQV